MCFDAIKGGQQDNHFAVLNKMLFDKFVFCAFMVAWTNAEQNIQLEIPQGFLKGLKTNTVLQNTPYYSFKGIPYAKPNVGINKFQVS